MDKEYIPSYVIKSNSTLVGSIPILNERRVTSVTNIYKKGTSTSKLIKTNGEISFNIKPEISPSLNTAFLEFTYLGSKTYVGDDSFEFTINYSDGTTALQVIKILVRQNEDVNNNKLHYIEVFCNKNENTASRTFNIDTSKFLPTSSTINISNSDFLVDKYTRNLDGYSKSCTIVGPVTKVEISASIDLVSKEMLNHSVNFINRITINLEKSNEYNKPNEYIKFNLLNFISTENGEDVKRSESYNIIFHQLNTVGGTEYYNEVFVDAFPPFEVPNFEYKDIEFPEAPTQDTFTDNTIFVPGDKLSNTRAHKLKDRKGNSTIRLGNTVPEDAVNLAYYYNATSSLENTVSVIETNTNTVTLHYVEDWVHKYNLPTDNEDQFLDYIEFNGIDGSDLEGFWGILYRDYILWEEEPLIDQNPEYVTVYEKFYGLSEKDIPLEKFHKNGKKSGMLKLSHSIYTAIDFERSKNPGYEFEPRRWKCLAKYEGMIKDTKVQYNGSARYSGVVTKKDGMSNLEPEQQKELVMFPDETGLLHLANGEKFIDDDLFYITDKFKDDIPLYYKHMLKFKIYDSIGPDKYGTYNTESIKVVTENHTPINENQYKYKVYIKETEFNNVYDAFIYTSFIPILENPIYVMYNALPKEAYEQDNIINPLNIKIGILEKLSVVPAYETDEYRVDVKQGITQKSTITINNPQIIDDLRESIKIEYIISADGISTPPIAAFIINKDFAIYNELVNFKNEDMIISTSNVNGHMTAKDILFDHISEEDKLKIKGDSVFKVIFNTRNPEILYNKDKVLLYTDTDGSGFIFARTYCDTGMPGIDGVKNRILDSNSIYVSDGKRIFKGFAVKCRNINQIVISTPSESDPLKGWYPRVRYSYFDKVYERIDGSVQLIYSVNEFNSQVFGKYGKPYIDIVDEKPRYIGSSTVKINSTPMYIKIDNDGNLLNLSAYKKLYDGTKRVLTIKNHNFKHGIVEFEDKISENDDIYVSYTYEEQYYHYKGFYNDLEKDTKLIDLNLNPCMYNTFTDVVNDIREKKNTYDLFNRTIHFFLRPMRIIDKQTGEIKTDNVFTLYHKFDNQESLGPFDLHIGRIFVRHHSSLQSTVLLDTRHRGGGLIESMKDTLRRELEPESDYYLDIGTLDGEPYQENSIIVIRLDNKLLRANGGIFSEQEIRDSVEKWSAYGTYHIIEFVEVLDNKDMPNNNMTINRVISNQIHYKPHFDIAVEEIVPSKEVFVIGKSKIGTGVIGASPQL